MLFICGSDLFIYLCAMANIVCGDPLYTSRRQQAGQGEGPRQSRNKNLLKYRNFDGTPRCNECYAASRKKDAMPVANRTRAGGGPVSEGLPEGRNGKRKQRTNELGLLADGNGVNTGKDDEDDKMDIIWMIGMIISRKGVIPRPAMASTPSIALATITTIAMTIPSTATSAMESTHRKLARTIAMIGARDTTTILLA